MNTQFPYHLIDLTHTLNEKTPSWNNQCGFNPVITLDYDDCNTDVKFRVQQLQMHAGIGTHIDTPGHCVAGGQTAESIPLDTLLAPLVVIDVSSKMTEDYKTSVSDITDFENQHGEIPDRSFVIFYTGWSRHWEQPSKYHNNHRFPTVSSDTASLLISKKIVGIGIDTLSPDRPDSGFPVHDTILGSGKYIIENVANADKMPSIGAYVLILPIKASGLTEAAVRMVGLISNQI